MQEPPVLDVNLPAATLDFEMELQDADISASLGSNLFDDPDFLSPAPDIADTFQGELTYGHCTHGTGENQLCVRCGFIIPITEPRARQILMKGVGTGHGKKVDEWCTKEDDKVDAVEADKKSRRGRIDGLYNPKARGGTVVQTQEPATQSRPRRSVPRKDYRGQ